MVGNAKATPEAAAPSRFSLLSWVLILLAVLVGVFAAVIVEGRMSHVRAAIGGVLPAWTVAIDPSAGLLSGGATAPGLRITWQAAAPEGANLLWTLGLTGTTIDGTTGNGTGRLALNLRNRTVVLTMAGGRVDLSNFPLSDRFGPLPGLDAPLHVSGGVDLTDLEARLPIGGGLADIQASVQAEIRDLTLDGTRWGGGGVSATMAPGRPVVAQVTLTGGVAPLRADLTLPDATATRLSITTEIGAAPGLPTDLRRLLETAAIRDGPVWRFGTTVVLE